MNMTIEDLIYARTSASSYDATRQLNDDEIEDLIRLATLAPSAFNAQNWRFIAVRSEDAKKKLLPLAYNQPKVVDAAVTFIICGTLEPHNSLPSALRPSVDAGIIDEAVYDAWIGAASGMYGDNPQFQRDEAIRSASLAAMTLMLAAQGRGLVSCPMIGFNATAVAEQFLVDENEVPVMLVTVGYPGDANWAQKKRNDVREVLSLI